MKKVATGFVFYFVLFLAGWQFGDMIQGVMRLVNNQERFCIDIEKK